MKGNESPLTLTENKWRTKWQKSTLLRRGCHQLLEIKLSFHVGSQVIISGILKNACGVYKNLEFIYKSIYCLKILPKFEDKE